MKIKLLQKIEVLGHQFTILYDKDKGGGFFDFAENVIGVGTKYIKVDPESVYNVLNHEIMEAVMTVLCLRYDDPSVSNNYKFFMDHKQFEVMVKIHSAIMYKFIK